MRAEALKVGAILGRAAVRIAADLETVEKELTIVFALAKAAGFEAARAMMGRVEEAMARLELNGTSDPFSEVAGRSRCLYCRCRLF